MESLFYVDLKDKFTLVNALVAYKLNADEKESKRADELLRRVLGAQSTKHKVENGIDFGIEVRV